MNAASTVTPMRRAGMMGCWDRSALALAREQCEFCRGAGFIPRYLGQRPCSCVYRAAFRIVREQWRSIQSVGGGFRQREFCADVYLVSRRVLVGEAAAELALASEAEERARCEYARLRNGATASEWRDAVAALQRALRRKDQGEIGWQVFRYFHLAGMDWVACARRVHLDKGNFFHYVYAVEAELGRAFGELRPYALFPVDEYLGGLAS